MNNFEQIRRLLIAFGMLSLVLSIWSASSAFAQGPLNPPGPPAPTMKSLDQVEPRTPITSLPFNITSSGSYYFTKNLHFTAESGDAITVSASDVTIDLMGFTLSSAATVTGGGINLGTAERCTVKNGIIVGTTTVTITGTKPARTWSVNPGGFEYGVRAEAGGGGTRFLELTAGNCRNDGIWTSQTQDSMAERCVARQNGGFGISATIVTNSVADSNGEVGISAATVTGSSAVDNGSNGIDTSRDGSATSCSASGNGGSFGIFAHSALNCLASENKGIGIAGRAVTGCAAELNGSHGIQAQTVVDSTSSQNNGDGIEGSNLKGCKAERNKGDGISATIHNSGAGASIQDCVASYNTGNGIRTADASKIVNNTATENGFETGNGAGIRVSGQKCRIDSNHVADNDRGIEVTGTRNLIVRNSSRSNGQNYVIVAGNRIARIVVPALNAANITDANNGSSDGFTDVDPWANFTF